jgi:hypothetical protein
MVGRWFSPGTTVSSTNNIDLHDIAERVLKVALNTITLTPTLYKNLLKNNLSKVLNAYRIFYVCNEYSSKTILPFELVISLYVKTFVIVS